MPGAAAPPGAPCHFSAAATCTWPAGSPRPVCSPHEAPPSHQPTCSLFWQAHLCTKKKKEISFVYTLRGCRFKGLEHLKNCPYKISWNILWIFLKHFSISLWRFKNVEIKIRTLRSQNFLTWGPSKNIGSAKWAFYLHKKLHIYNIQWYSNNDTLNILKTI